MKKLLFSVSFATIAIFASCSDDSEPAGFCSGEPYDCSDVTTCSNQDGCYDGQVCTGFAFSCDLYFDTECFSQFGCSYNFSCTGTPTYCESRSQYDCEDQRGCYWSLATDSCGGTPTPCNELFTESTCDSQNGCYSHVSCEGSSTACWDMDTQDCLIQDGCSLGSGCEGTPVACDSKTSKSSCENHRGCIWTLE
ncbi:hypothetical protein KKF34_17985 [Myxococcota bacterium]|nr:hypothetical protein [Myxococcota bacterium]MBU1379890.1 hypothetical protein [Myxococcota bacterium]MBU1498775.1 hypothetical protein [Myxococcota bacterium]